MGRRDFFEERKLNKIIYVFVITLVISVIAFLIIFSMYNNKLKEEASKDLLELGKASNIVSNEDLENFEETSFSEDKNISEINNSTKNTNIEKDKSVEKNNKEKSSENKIVNKEPVSAVVKNVENTTNTENVSNNETKENIVSEENKVVEENTLTFMAPVSGEISKDFALDTLVYSDTLAEWTTHSGIDIKAEKTSIVVASERGVVESIKNDPRYGLTVTIVHDNNFKTIYSNLLTTEFVKEGEIVEKGQTIGTIGESASFEIADESHLHFEMYKDGILVNPTIYLEDK